MFADECAVIHDIHVKCCRVFSDDVLRYCKEFLHTIENLFHVSVCNRRLWMLHSYLNFVFMVFKKIALTFSCIELINVDVMRMQSCIWFRRSSTIKLTVALDVAELTPAMAVPVEFVSGCSKLLAPLTGCACWCRWWCELCDWCCCNCWWCGTPSCTRIDSNAVASMLQFNMHR